MAITGQPQRDSHKGQAEQNMQNKTLSKNYQEWDCQDRAAWIGLQNRVTSTVLPAEDYTGLL